MARVIATAFCGSSQRCGSVGAVAAVAFPQAALARGKQAHARGALQDHDLAPRQRRQRARQIGLEIGPDLEDQPGAGDLLRIGGLERIGVLGLRAADEEVGRGAHHGGDERMDGLDRRQHLRVGGAGQQCDDEGCGSEAAQANLPAMFDSTRPPEFADVEAAARRIAPYAVVTPLIESAALNARLGGRVFLKLESLQRTGSFKFRGAYNRISLIPDGERPRRRGRVLLRQSRARRRGGGADLRHPGRDRDAQGRAARPRSRARAATAPRWCSTTG